MRATSPNTSRGITLYCYSLGLILSLGLSTLPTSNLSIQSRFPKGYSPQWIDSPLGMFSPFFEEILSPLPRKGTNHSPGYKYPICSYFFIEFFQFNYQKVLMNPLSDPFSGKILYIQLRSLPRTEIGALGLGVGSLRKETYYFPPFNFKCIKYNHIIRRQIPHTLNDMIRWLHLKRTLNVMMGVVG